MMELIVIILQLYVVTNRFNCFIIILLLKNFEVIAVIINLYNHVTCGDLISHPRDNGDDDMMRSRDMLGAINVISVINVSIQLLIRPRDITDF